MARKHLMEREPESYFDQWADQYAGAFSGSSPRPWTLQWLINRIYREKTFRLRQADVEEIVGAIGLNGVSFLDVGCGPGHLCVFAARHNARCTGIDASGQMIRLAQQLTSGLDVQLEQRDAFSTTLPRCQVVACIGVIEYFPDLDAVMERLCAAAGSHLVICDTRFVWWRAILRLVLARMKGFPLFYHRVERVKSLAATHGFACREERVRHSYRFFVFESEGHPDD
jgi:2-polyprenyl-3-methyl-5-hydroxy-6-metoxy-1,4-benzoquinol methylase